jgi:hypothetical protein
METIVYVHYLKTDIVGVGMCDCWLQGIQPSKWKGNGHQ